MSVRIHSLNYAAEGLTDRGVPVAFTLPGELVEIDPLRILEPSPERVTPPCPHFGVCGGCQLQHAAYPAQLDLKAAQLRGLLAAIPSLPEIVIHPSPSLGYRNRIRLTLAQVEGVLRAGYIRHHSNAFLPIDECPIAAPILWRVAEAVLCLAPETPLLRMADQLELFTDADETRLQLTLFLRARSSPAAAAFAAFCEALRVRIPELTGAGTALLPPGSVQHSRRMEVARPGAAWGAPGLSYSVGPLPYWVPRTAFFQANRFLLPELLALVADGRTGALAWDLYAGIGLFSRALAASFARVDAVEIAEPAFTALASTGLGKVRAAKATTLHFLRAAVVQRERPSLIVLDPPRAGAGAEVSALLDRIAAPTVVYVSCGPQALAADLAALTDSGYSVEEMHLFDLFPQTHHIEAVAVLRR
jgi:23S rRNA (uracil1939-C5)-methyltransferase